MSIVKLKDKRSGTIYVYESQSYWDKEKKQPRARRKLIGKLDPVSGEIVPTGKSGRKKRTSMDGSIEPITEYVQVIKEKDALIHELKTEIKTLKKEKQEIHQMLMQLCRKTAD